MYHKSLVHIGICMDSLIGTINTYVYLHLYLLRDNLTCEQAYAHGCRLSQLLDFVFLLLTSRGCFFHWVSDVINFKYIYISLKNQ